MIEIKHSNNVKNLIEPSGSIRFIQVPVGFVGRLKAGQEAVPTTTYNPVLDSETIDAPKAPEPNEAIITNTTEQVDVPAVSENIQTEESVIPVVTTPSLESQPFAEPVVETPDNVSDFSAQEEIAPTDLGITTDEPVVSTSAASNEQPVIPSPTVISDDRVLESSDVSNKSVVTEDKMANALAEIERITEGLEAMLGIAERVKENLMGKTPEEQLTRAA